MSLTDWIEDRVPRRWLEAIEIAAEVEARAQRLRDEYAETA